ncbi:MAG: SDR family NAD(P)-dependent oxidoreductase [Gemmatimonadaceae bacterium]
MTRVVITGATGFIGRRLLELLLRDGVNGESAHIVAIARHHETLPAALRNAVETHALDLAEAPVAAIARACGQGALVFHLAANAAVGSGEAGYRNNVRSVERLLEALHACAPARVVYASSIGAVDRLPGDDCSSLLDEAAVPHPLTRYGEGKLEGERLLKASGLPFAIVRPTWVYGPGMRADSHVRVFLGMVRAGKPVTRLGFPGRVSLVHVDDLCAALLLAGTHAAAAGQTCFATDDAPVSIGELFRELGEITGRTAGGLRLPGMMVATARFVRRWLPLSVQCLNSDVLAASSARLSALGFAPAVPRRRGLIELARAAAPGGGRWVVTGAASGIGRALAVQLHTSGHDVVAIDRDAAGLASLALECPGTSTVPADLSTDDGRTILGNVIDDGPLAGLVNCAGIGARGDVREVTDAAQARLLSVNILALAESTARAARQMTEQPGGGIVVNVASSAALQPLPGMAAYAASKAFVLSFSEAASEELAGTQVRVITVCPGGTDTGFQAASGVKRVEGERLMPAAEVAAIILAAIQRGRPATLLVSGRTKAMALMARVLPRRQLVRLWGRLMGSMR